MSDACMRVARNMKRLLTEQGLSVRKAASMIGVDYSYLSNMLNGKANPSIKTLEKISNGLGVDIADLFK